MKIPMKKLSNSMTRSICLAIAITSVLAAAAPAPQIASVYISNNTMTIVGANFSPYGNNPSVYLDDISLSIKTFQNDEVICTIPSGDFQAGYTYGLLIT